MRLPCEVPLPDPPVVCVEVGIIAPIYTWERWQSRCMLHKLLHPVACTWEVGSSLSLSSSLSPTASKEVRMGLLGA